MESYWATFDVLLCIIVTTILQGGEIIGTICWGPKELLRSSVIVQGHKTNTRERQSRAIVLTESQTFALGICLVVMDESPAFQPEEQRERTQPPAGEAPQAGRGSSRGRPGSSAERCSARMRMESARARSQRNPVSTILQTPGAGHDVQD